MPEGDTIRRLARRITARLGGAACTATTVRDNRLVGFDVTGTTLVEADAHGKHLLVRFDDGRTLHAHLQMSGSFVVGRRSRAEPWRRRLEVRTTAGWLTAEDVPVLEVVSSAAEHDAIGHLGPDLCGAASPDLHEIAARMAAAGDMALGAAMLDQRIAAGWGNLYAVEVPFVCGVRPTEPVSRIVGLDRLVAVGAALIRTNAELGPQNTTGRRLSRADHWIYGRARRPCPWCGTRLDGRSEPASPWGRLTTWCPSCQPAGDPGVVDRDRIRRALSLHPARRTLVALTAPPGLGPEPGPGPTIAG